MKGVQVGIEDFVNANIWHLSFFDDRLDVQSDAQREFWLRSIAKKVSAPAFRRVCPVSSATRAIVMIWTRVGINFINFELHTLDDYDAGLLRPHQHKLLRDGSSIHQYFPISPDEEIIDVWFRGKLDSHDLDGSLSV